MCSVPASWRFPSAESHLPLLVTSHCQCLKLLFAPRQIEQQLNRESQRCIPSTLTNISIPPHTAQAKSSYQTSSQCTDTSNLPLLPTEIYNAQHYCVSRSSKETTQGTCSRRNNVLNRNVHLHVKNSLHCKMYANDFRQKRPAVIAFHFVLVVVACIRGVFLLC